MRKGRMELRRGPVLAPGGGARKRIAHLDRLPSDLRAVERVHRVLGVVLVLEGNEAEGLALRAENFCDGAELSEGLPEGVLIGASEHEARVAVHGPETERGDRGRGFARQLRTRNRAARRVASPRAPDVVVPLPKAGRGKVLRNRGGSRRTSEASTSLARCPSSVVLPDPTLSRAPRSFCVLRYSLLSSVSMFSLKS